MSNYFKKWNLLPADNKHPVLFFDQLDSADWIEFLMDYYGGNHSDILNIFFIPTSSGIEHILIYLDDLSIGTKGKLANAIEIVFQSYFNDRNEDLMEDVLHTVRYLELHVKTDDILLVFFDRKFSKSLRSHAAITLVVLKDFYLNSMWDNVDLQKDTFLLPSFLWFYEKSNPTVPFHELAAFNDLPEGLLADGLISPIADLLGQVSLSHSEIDEFKTMFFKFPIWLKELIENVLAESNELTNVKNALNYKANDLVKVKLALSIFPDLLLPEYYKQLGIFEDFGINLEITYVDWNQIFNQLKKKKADYIIGNHGMMDIENHKSGKDLFYPLFPIDRFVGFHLIGNNNNVPKFEYYHKATGGDSITESLSAYFRDYISDQIIYTSANTDHYTTFINILHCLDLSEQDFTFKNNLDPNNSFFAYLKETKSACFIGAASHTKNLLNDYHGKYNVLVESSDLSKDLVLQNIVTQYNVLIGSNMPGGKSLPVKEEIELKLKFAFDEGYKYIESNFQKASKDLHSIYENKILTVSKDSMLLSLEFDEYYEILKEIVDYQVSYTISQISSSGSTRKKAKSTTIKYTDS